MKVSVFYNLILGVTFCLLCHMLLAVTTKLAPYRGNYTTVLIPGIEIIEGSAGGCALQAVCII